MLTNKAQASRGALPLGERGEDAMEHKKIAMGRRKKVALVAHDNTKFDRWSGQDTTGTCSPSTTCSRRR